MKIMLLDDDKSLIGSLERLLVSMGHEVDTFNVAKEALEPARTGGYDFAFIDYRMPDNTGVWFLENAEIPKQTRILLMTAYVSRKVIVRMFELGACGYLIKPFDEEEIRLHLDFHSQ
ncbi:hypothetical protein BVX97_02285 [bacterium E08(2017)]|nr:hypothetical protein BVX97_02285 [bacterium E08(2017)]